MRIAVIGGGISGLGAAYVLSRAHEVEVFERHDRPGGHANTVVRHGLALDTGFLVHNRPSYPLLGRLFRELGVATHATDMSFSVSCPDCGLEYSGRRPFAQGRNAASPRFAALLWEIGRWLRTAPRSLGRAEAEGWSLARLLDEGGYSPRFRRHFLVPLTAASSCARTTASCARSTRPSSPSTPTRRSRCSPIRPKRSGGSWAPSRTPRTRRSCTRTRPSCRGRGPRARRGTTGSARRGGPRSPTG